MAAPTTIGAANRFQYAAGLCPCAFGGPGFDEEDTPVVRSVVFLSHPLDDSVSHIDGIKSHVAFLPLVPGELYAL